MKPSEITQAVVLLRAGELVAFPTETVYGLGADAANEQAVRKVFRVKERPYDHPLIVHLADMNQLNDWALNISPMAQLLAKAYWPGPLTMVFKKQPHVLEIVTGGQDTVAVRIPNHPIAHALLMEFGNGVVAPSANKFTHISPTTAQAVYEELGDSVNLILDGGECDVGLESTIIDMSSEQPVILRPGMITAETISAKLGLSVMTVRQDVPGVRAPGRHHLHYAPATKTQLISTSELLSYLQSLQPEELPIAVMVYSEMMLPQKEQVHYIKMPSQAAPYAHDLYDTLRSLDHQQFKKIVIERVPHGTEWEAIRDRLIKATAER